MMSVEIPQRDKDRYLVAWGTGLFKLVDDFVLSSPSNRILEVKLEGTKLIYCDDKGVKIREHDITP
jgi:hypothetical protein